MKREEVDGGGITLNSQYVAMIKYDDETKGEFQISMNCSHTNNAILIQIKESRKVTGWNDRVRSLEKFMNNNMKTIIEEMERRKE